MSNASLTAIGISIAASNHLLAANTDDFMGRVTGAVTLSAGHLDGQGGKATSCWPDDCRRRTSYLAASCQHHHNLRFMRRDFATFASRSRLFLDMAHSMSCYRRRR